MAAVREIPDIFNQATFLVDRHIAEGRGGNTAIHYEDKKITYAELAGMVNRTGNAFKGLGVEMENRVMLILPDCPEFFYCYLGVMKTGAVPVPVNNLGAAKDYEYFLNDSRAKAVVLSPEVLPKILEIKDELKHLRHIIMVGPETEGTIDFNALTAGASTELEAAETSKDDMAFWMYTSGTTGLPKGVVHLHQDLPYYIPPVGEAVCKMTEDDIVFCSSKMFFSYGRNNSLEMPLYYGASMVLYPHWPRPEMIFQIIDKYKPTLFFSVPTLYNALLREAGKEGFKGDLSSLRLCMSSGEALPKLLFEGWNARFGLGIMDIIGSTDVGGVYLGNRPEEVKPGSNGKLLPGFEGKLVDPDGEEVAPGEAGTLWLKNGGVASRYWNKHQRSREVFMGQWFNSGDLFSQDEDGFYWYQGRADDMLKVSGQWVSPIEIEEVIREHPAVVESAVVGHPDEAGLLRVSAFVVLEESASGSPQLGEELANMVYDRIAHFKKPRWVNFVKELPRTPTGKIQRHKLRQK